jgi:transcription elongation GreA/GreB family factor
MSRAFVKEDDGTRPEALPELPVSPLPNLVTARGLGLIDAQIARLEAALAAGPDEIHQARLRRDLRYWRARRASARLTTPDPADPAAQFGSRVVYADEDGETRTLEIVGEDEADPASGTISYAAPVARALIGAKAGDAVAVTLRGRTVELEVLEVAPAAGPTPPQGL